MSEPTVRLDDLLFSQGFGTRRVCAGLVAAGQVRVGGQVLTDPATELAADGLAFEVGGQPWVHQATALVLLHKPAGVVTQHPSYTDLAQGDAHLDDVLQRLHVVSLPMRVRFRGVDVREVALIEGPAGWGEFGAFLEYEPAEAVALVKRSTCCLDAVYALPC